MTAKEFLTRYRLISSRIEMLAAEIEKIEAQAAGGGQNMDGQPHGTGKSDRVANAAIKAAEATTELEKLKAEQEAKRNYIMFVLNKIDDLEQFEVLKLRYIDPKPANEWWNIAEVVGKSTRHVQRIHGYALLKVQKILDETEVRP